ncbi:hypothetical protein BJV78DRAFT_1102973, partial [Lactifluus subvellereus]
CDLVVLSLTYDEFTDKADGDGTRVCAEIVMHAIQSPHKECPQGETNLGEIARQ